jgi:hypothetical protein
MNMIQGWKESLSLLRPAKLKPFLLVTLNAYIKMWKPLLQTWWWLVGLYVIAVCARWIYFAPYMTPNGVDDQIKTKMTVLFIALALLNGVIIGSFLLYQMLLIVRPSVEPKNRSYLWRWSRYFIPTAVIVLVAMILMAVVYVPFSFIMFLSPEGAVIFKRLSPIIIAMIGAFSIPLYVFTALFFLDGSKKLRTGFKALWRAINLTCYKYPLLLIGYVLFLPLGYVHAYLYNFSGIFTNQIMRGLFFAKMELFQFIVIPLILCLLTNLYIQQIHEHPELYFNEPKE